MLDIYADGEANWKYQQQKKRIEKKNYVQCVAVIQFLGHKNSLSAFEF